jgi:hypothetical protein
MMLMDGLLDSGKASSAVMASEYGSSPVEDAAHQMDSSLAPAAPFASGDPPESGNDVLRGRRR